MNVFLCPVTLAMPLLRENASKSDRHATLAKRLSRYDCPMNRVIAWQLLTAVLRLRKQIMNTGQSSLARSRSWNF